jgi:hypothetical protein
MRLKETLCPYKASRLYLEDSRSVLDPKLVDSIMGAIRSRQPSKIIELVTTPKESLNTPLQAKTLAQIAAFFKKNKAFADNVGCTESARLNFERGERLCRITNRRLDWFYFHPERVGPSRKAVVSKIRATIARVLGDPADFIGRIPDLVKVTSGATSDQPRARSLPYMKVRKVVTCTHRAWPYVDALSVFHTGASPRAKHSDSVRIAVVPKDMTTHRTIGCEPLGNLPFQLAVDRYVKDRLKTVLGIDLRDQSTNQKLAWEGSQYGLLATIDLSMASDTVAYNTVAYLLPEGWLKVLDDLRTPCYDGIFGRGLFAKYSTMGNGFTFVLETLLFSAFCVAIGSERFSVYGDDIIIESNLYEDLVGLLKWFGFVPNLSKSYSRGPFRESCGKDYFGGIDVRPFFLRDTARSKPELCHLINGLAEAALPGGRLWGYLKSLVLKEGLKLVPYNDSSESGIFIHPSSAYDLCLMARSRRTGWIDVFTGYSTTPKSYRHYGVRALLLWHFRTFARELGGSGDCLEQQCSWQAAARRVEYTSLCLHGVDRAEVTSEGASPSSTKTRTRRLRWTLPPGPIPVHLYWWTDCMLAR